MCSNFRIAGEFEPQKSVLTAWPLVPYSAPGLNVDEVEADIVSALIGEVEVLVSCYDESVKERASKALSERGVDIRKIRFVIYPSPIIYPRDFGAEVMTDGRGSGMLAKFRFNTYGFYAEDHPTSKLLASFAEFHARHVGIEKSIAANLISEGGDREFNGRGVMMSIVDTELRKRNPDQSLDTLEKEFKRVLNLEKIIWLPCGTYDDENPFDGPIPSEDGNFTSYRASSANGHIDEMCRFVDAGTVLLARISREEADKSELHALNKKRLDQAYEVLKEECDAEGKPLKIITMPVPEPIYLDIAPEDDAYASWAEEGREYAGMLLNGQPFPSGKMNVLPALSYCNFLVANGIVLAQKYYRDGMPAEIKRKDEEAARVLKDVFPGRKIVPVFTLPLNLYGGGIHCNTRNVPA